MQQCVHISNQATVVRRRYLAKLSELTVRNVIMEGSFPRHYTQKAFTSDASRLRDILRLQTRQQLTEAELGQITELRKKLKRIDGDVAMMLVVWTRLSGGHNWF